MDDDFSSEPLKTPCMSDFPQLQTTATPSSEYDLQVFSPSFDTTCNTFSNPATPSKAGTSTGGQHGGKGFLEDDTMIDLQLYDSLQNHHNYSLKPAEPGSILSAADSGGILSAKHESSSVNNFRGVSNLADQLADGPNDLGNESYDQSMDISDPLKEICRSSSPLFVPSQSKQSHSEGSHFKQSQSEDSHLVYNPMAAEKREENNGELKDSLFEKQSGTDAASNAIAESLLDLQPVKNDVEDTVTIRREIPEDVCAGREGSTIRSHIHSTETLEAIEDKAMFSENLGLIPADSGRNNLAEKPSVRKGVRTRRSFEVAALIDERAPVRGHKHSPALYRCGSCNKTFVNICKLHQHFQDHDSGGSYHYNHVLKTAFPKFDTVCAYTQTAEKEPRLTPKVSPFGRGIMLKTKTVNESPEEPVIAAKRKRRRPRKLLEAENQLTEPQEKQKSIGKLKIKIEDSGNTWTEVRNKPKEAKKQKTKTSSETILNGIIDSVKESEENSINENIGIDFNPPENDINIMTEEERMDEVKIKSPSKNSHKRKMSVPRKIPHAPGVENKKIINSRVKPEFKITCDFCPCQFQYTRGLIRHEQEKHADEMKFECDICDLKFMRSYNLERHKLCIHTTGKSRLIRQRKSISIWREKKKRGRKPLERSPENATTCEVCGKSLPESKAEIHLRLHTGERPFICHVCGKGLISDKKLKRHLLIHSDTKRHTCEVCGEGFAMKNKLSTHMFIHTGHKPYLCSVCGAEFNNSTSLLHHHRTVHLGDKRFECNICGGRYGKKSQLEEHMFSHSSERTQTCRFCGKSFKHAKSLRRHETTHVSDQKFSCDQCDSKFSRKDNLERHKMCHMDSFRQCRFCKKKFRDRQPLLDHEQFHINQRKLQCLVCKDKFQDETYFYTHMEKTHDLDRKIVDAMIETRETNEQREIEAKEMLSQGIVVDTSGDQMEQPGTITIVQDTLNFSMNLAGIIPSSGQDLITGTNSGPLHGATTVHNILNQSLDPGQNIIITNGTQILNQSGHAGFATRIIPGTHDGQRVTFSTGSTMDGSSLRLPINQHTASIPLTSLSSDNVIIHEQQRLMQEALGTSLNGQNSGFRMQNLF